MKSSEPNTALAMVPAVDILMCKILVWEPKSKSTIDYEDPDENKCLVIRECQSIEIDESYKKLIGTAIVKFPRGTVVEKTLTVEGEKEEPSGPVSTERLDSGAVTEKRKGQTVAVPADFRTGQRIRIYLGYYRDEGSRGKYVEDRKERLKMMEEKAFGDSVPDFDGYIVKCSASTPIELKCENLASALKRKTCRKTPPILNASVNMFLDGNDKRYYQLEGTGLELDEDTASCDIRIGKIAITDDWTVADLLTYWAKYKLYSFIRCDRNGKPKLKVGRSYFSTKTKESLVNDSGSSKIPVIQFDYHVADDGLTMMNSDPQYLAVSAEGFKMEGGKEKKYSVTIRLNPEWTGKDDTEHKKFQILNETKLSKKAMKMGAVPKSGVKDRVDLSQYNIIPFTSAKLNITEEELIQEAQAYFDSYNMNGVEGTLRIFGDKYETCMGTCHLQSGMKVELLDTRQPEKNGWYLIEEVNTKFGTDGFRQTLKLPYCIAKPKTSDGK
jgi:hypothetical protein